VADGEMTEKQRNKLLAEMTDEVGLLVLQDNYFQTQALSVAGRVAPVLVDAEARLIRWLERAGRLNRPLEFLPTDEDIAERKALGAGLTSPERAVLLAYSKMWLYDELLASDMPEDALVAGLLADYFPAAAPALRAGHAAPSAAARDPGHAPDQHAGEPRRCHVRPPPDGRNRRAPADIVRACLLARRVRAYRALGTDRRARQSRRRRRAGAHVRRSGAAARTRHALVHPLSARRRYRGAGCSHGSSMPRTGSRRNCRRCCRPSHRRPWPNAPWR
jgi:hypothetical protein